MAEVQPIDSSAGDFQAGYYLTLQAWLEQTSRATEAGIFVMPDEADRLLRGDGCDLPPAGLAKNAAIYMALHEPRFARRFSEQIEKGLDRLGVSSITGLAIRPENAADFKSGRLLQVMFDYRKQGVIQQVGIVHDDVRTVEWAIENAGPHFVAFPFAADQQEARYRLINKAREYEVAMFGCAPASSVGNVAARQAFQFAGQQQLGVTPILSEPVETGADPLSVEEFEASWQAYQKNHAPPAELKRGKPPE